MRTNLPTTLYSGKTKDEAEKLIMKIITFVLALFCCISCTQTYKNYDDFLVDLKKETKDKTSIDLLYVGSIQNQDRFLLNNKKAIVKNGSCLSKVAPFVQEAEKYDFISWNTERRLQLKAALIHKDGNADLSYASLDNKNVFVIDRDMPHQRRDDDSNSSSSSTYDPNFYERDTKDAGNSSSMPPDKLHCIPGVSGPGAPSAAEIDSMMEARQRQKN